MGKAADRERKRQRKARDKVLNPKGMNDIIAPEDCLDHHSYWITGYYWHHDVNIVEPFCAVKRFNQWEITNLSANTFEYHQAMQILYGEGSMLIYTDRVAALKACEAIENENKLLTGFAEFMPPDALVEYLDGKMTR